MISHLVDTHILVWGRQDLKRLSKAQAHLLAGLEAQGQVVGVSAISLRELAKMIQGRRIEVDAPLETRLGDDLHRDPADQIIVATARCHDLTLITADERIRRWGKVRVV